MRGQCPPSSREKRCGTPSTSTSRSSPLVRGHGPVGPAEELEPALVRPEPPSDQLDRVPVDDDPVAVGGDLRDGELVGLPAVAQLVGARKCAARSRTASASERVEAGAVIGRVPVGQLDRCLEQRQIGVARVNASRHSGTAARASRCRHHRRVARDGRAAGAESPGSSVPPSTTATVSASARRSRASASPRSLPQAVSVTISRVELGRDCRSPSTTPVSTRRPGPVGSRRWTSRPGAGAKSSGRVLGAEARLDGVPDRRRRVALEPPARGDVQLELDQVEAGDRLAHRMAELRRHFREIEATRFGLVEELDRPCAAVSGVPRQPLRRVHDVSLLIGGEGRTRGFGEDRLPPPLTGAIAYTERPHRAVAVGERSEPPVGAPRRGRSTPPPPGRGARRRSCASVASPPDRAPTNTSPSRSQRSLTSGRSATSGRLVHAASARASRSARSRPVGARIEAHGLVGVANEQRVALGLGVQGDQADRGGATLVQLAHGVNDAHRGFAAIDDGQAGELALEHRIPSGAGRRADLAVNPPRRSPPRAARRPRAIIGMRGLVRMLGSMNAALASSGSAASKSSRFTPQSASERGSSTSASSSSTRANSRSRRSSSVRAAETEDPPNLRILLGCDVGGVAGRRHELTRQRRVVAQHVGQEDRVRAAVRDPERAPRPACASAWLSPTNAFENASPAIVAALCHRGARLEVGTRRGRHAAAPSKIRLAACTQNASVNGEAKIDTAASSAWVSASMPVSAVICCGIVSVSVRVDDRHVGHERVVDQRDLALSDGDHGGRRDLRAGAGRRRDRDQPAPCARSAGSCAMRLRASRNGSESSRTLSCGLSWNRRIALAASIPSRRRSR